MKRAMNLRGSECTTGCDSSRGLILAECGGQLLRKQARNGRGPHYRRQVKNRCAESQPDGTSPPVSDSPAEVCQPDRGNGQEMPPSVAADRHATNHNGLAGALKTAKSEKIKNRETLSGSTSGRREHYLYQPPWQAVGLDGTVPQFFTQNAQDFADGPGLCDTPAGVMRHVSIKYLRRPSQGLTPTDG